MNPPVDADTYFLWFGPLVLLVIGGVVIGMTVMRARKRLATEPPSQEP
jgi:cytochrome c-type biogenesis protein CcmH/NrfF